MTNGFNEASTTDLFERAAGTARAFQLFRRSARIAATRSMSLVVDVVFTSMLVEERPNVREHTRRHATTHLQTPMGRPALKTRLEVGGRQGVPKSIQLLAYGDRRASRGSTVRDVPQLLIVFDARSASVCSSCSTSAQIVSRSCLVRALKRASRPCSVHSATSLSAPKGSMWSTPGIMSGTLMVLRPCWRHQPEDHVIR